MGVNKLFERVEGLVSDALKRIDSLQNQVHELREQMMERVGLAEKAPKKSAKSTSTSSKAAGKSASSGASTTQKRHPAAVRPRSPLGPSPLRAPRRRTI